MRILSFVWIGHWKKIQVPMTRSRVRRRMIETERCELLIFSRKGNYRHFFFSLLKRVFFFNKLYYYKGNRKIQRNKINNRNRDW